MKKLLLASFVSLALFSQIAVATQTIKANVNGMVCAFCAQGIEKTLRKNPATEDVVVSLESKLVAVGTKPGQDIPDADLVKAITNAGYEVKEITRTERSLAEIRASLRQK